MHHAIGRRPDEQDAEGESGQVLLELDAPIHRDQSVVLVLHAPEKLAVRNARPTTADYSVDSMAFECYGEI